MQEPRPESRIKSLENRASTIEATLIELSSDTAEELKAIRQDNKALFQHVQQGFDQAHTYIAENIETVLTDHTKRLNRVEGKIDSMQAQLTQILQLLQQKPSE